MDLENKDSSSWVVKDEQGNVQMLFLDFTHTHPGDSILNQVYYKQDLPPMTAIVLYSYVTVYNSGLGDFFSLRLRLFIEFITTQKKYCGEKKSIS